MKFCPLKTVNRAMDTRIWSAKWRNWNISDIPILLFEFSRGTKPEETARNIYAVYGDNVIGETTARKCIHLFKKYNVNLQSRTKYAMKLKTVQICIYMPNENLSIFCRMLGIEFKSV